MRKCILLILLFLPFVSTAQENLKTIRTNSWQTQAYKISAADVEAFIKYDSIPVSRFVDAVPYKTFYKKYVDNALLGLGNFILISTIENRVKAELVNNSDLVLLTINNKDFLQIDVRDKKGNFIENASVFVNEKKAKYNNESKTYWVKQHKLDSANVKVYTPTDTIYKTLLLKNDLRKSVAKQKIQNFKFKKIYRIINWIPSQTRKLFAKKRTTYNIGATGYIIFNQPKYKPLDTLKFKAYIVDKKWKQYNKQLNVFISYYNKNKTIVQLIKPLKPTTAGAYVYEFVLSDTLPLDIRYTLILKTINDKTIITNYFKIEEYVLDEIGSYNFISDKNTYYRNDSLRFFANAKDANGLNLLDGKATLILTTNNINATYKDTTFVIDTIYKKEVKLHTTDDTKFVIPATALPQALLDIEAKLIFKNSNNELHEENKQIKYKYNSKEIIVTQYEDSIKAIYLENGIENITTGELEIDLEDAIKITYPYISKIDPVVEEYTFLIDDKAIGVKTFEIKKDYNVNLNVLSKGDTLGFELNNPFKIPVYFTVFDGQKIVATSKSSLPQIAWEKVISNNRKMYKVRWQYFWAGEEKSYESNIGLYYKKLNINLTAKDLIFPGQKDSLKINVTDFKGKPIKNVNLTSVSYNNQFKNAIRVKDPPYLAKYKSKGFLEREEFEKDDIALIEKNYSLGKNQQWINKLHIDTMTYYKLLFPINGMYDAYTRINNFMPQLSVSLIDKGEPQEIYLLYINRNLVYYNGVTDRMKYAYKVYPGIVQIGIRTKNKYIEIDSVYIQPFYKHDISFDINNLPKNAKSIAAKKYWTYSEMNLLENSIWQMQNDYKNNYAYLWQGSSLVNLNGNREHIAGPFAQDSIQFFSPFNFVLTFKFEPGYQYRLSKNTIRLEKKPLFLLSDTNNLLKNYSSSLLQLGDTIVDPPVINYPKPIKNKFLKETVLSYTYRYYAHKLSGRGRIQYTLHKDSTIQYLVLYKRDSSNVELVIDANGGRVNNLQPGKYTMLLVTKYFNTTAINDIIILPNGTTCIKADTMKFYGNNEIVNKLLLEAEEKLQDIKILKAESNRDVAVITSELRALGKGTAVIQGKVIDEKTKMPIPFCSLFLKGYRTGAVTDENGKFIIENLPSHKYIIEITSVAYLKKTVVINLNEGEVVDLKFELVFSNESLNEVVVIGALGISRKTMSMSYATSKVSSDMINSNEPINILQGKVSGVNITNNQENLDDVKLKLRGIRSITGNNEPLLIIDGIVTKSVKLSSLNPNDFSNVIYLLANEAIALYGSDGVNGAIIITTKNKTERKNFKDYAIWQPNFFTDKNGKASFVVEYPDNITSWKTYVLAMDKKRRVGSMSFLTQAYKPISAQLNLPQFLLQGDTSFFVAKSMNQTSDKYNAKTDFYINDKLKNTTQKELVGNDASIEMLQVVANLEDTITAKYALQTTTGFKDAEERKLPVFKKGTEEAIGNFWVLQNDTTVAFKSMEGKTEINMYAQNNTIDVLLEEIDHLKNYPYACMEQTTSKLIGLVMEKKIKEQLALPFTNQKSFDVLLQKIQKAQLFDGGWPWWENGKSNLYITNYILNALLLYRQNVLVETNIRNGFLYLQNQLPNLTKPQLLASLYTLSNGKHEMDFSKWISKISFDSLSQHEQWQWISIKQQQKMTYEKELKILIDKKTLTMLGGIHWGNNNYSWYSNDVATTVNAFNVLKNEPSYKVMLPSIIQYFLEKRQIGYWANTVESASILNAILPEILNANKSFTAPAGINITGDTSFSIKNFPFKLISKNETIKNINISKTGGGLVYFTAYQKIFNAQPTAIKTNFEINTLFKNANQTIGTIKAGERIKMIIEINALKDAEYVMLQVPIPAGCLYANKTGYANGVYREFFIDKVAMFIESLPKGRHNYEIELEPRYNGTYTLNPTKVELMYYPTFFGRNELKKVLIVE